MICVRLETEGMRLHTLGVKRTYHLRLLVVCSCVLVLLSQGGQVGIWWGTQTMQEQRRRADEAAAKANARVESMRSLEQRAGNQRRWQIQVDDARAAVTKYLRVIASAAPLELSLLEMWLEGDSIRLRGIAAHGVAIQDFLDRLATLLPIKEATLKNVQRIEDRAGWHDQFLIQLLLSEGGGARANFAGSESLSARWVY